MKKKAWGVIIALVAALAAPVTALAATNWNVTYTTGGDLQENFTTTDVRQNMQPGDTETFEINLSQDYDDEARWYMSNKVLETLQGTLENGSAYSYVLTFNGPSGETTLFDSTIVGGTNSQGLVEATDGLDEWFYLDTFKKGSTGKVSLAVTMDGDTEANEYFDTEALLNMKFAVEPGPEDETVVRRKIVRTGDETNLMPFYVAMVASGVLLVALGGYSVMQRKKEKKEGVR